MEITEVMPSEEDSIVLYCILEYITDSETLENDGVEQFHVRIDTKDNYKVIDITNRLN